VEHGSLDGWEEAMATGADVTDTMDSSGMAVTPPPPPPPSPWWSMVLTPSVPRKAATTSTATTSTAKDDSGSEIGEGRCAARVRLL